MADITSANSVLTLVVPALFPAPQQLQGYATDDAFADEALQLSESVMGVDGRKSAGYTPAITKQTITLQADSPSMSFFEAIMQAMKQQRGVLRIEGSLVIPSTGRSYVLTNGSLETVKQMPDGKKILQPQAWVIAWEAVSPSIL